jgi:hypothetical protein
MKDLMNRRFFMSSVGWNCASTIIGCAALRGSKEDLPVSDTPSSAATDKTADWDISVCGLNCARCKLLAKGECAGCRGPLADHWSPGCKFLPCARARGHRYCFQCDDFPCEKLHAFASDGYEHHRLTIENLKEMKAMGLESWLAKQPKVMFCPGWRF